MDVVVLALAWIGGCGVVWSLVHGRILWLQWRDLGMRPGPLGFGLWVQFTGMACVVGVSLARRVWPHVEWAQRFSEAALLVVAVAMTWLTGHLIRRWIRMCPRCAAWRARRGR